MENALVVGILNIVEDKLREFNIQIPDDMREDSTDPIVGYQYAELHDRIKEYLEDEGVLTDLSGPPKSERKRKFSVGDKVCVNIEAVTKGGKIDDGSILDNFVKHGNHEKVFTIKEVAPLWEAPYILDEELEETSFEASELIAADVT